MSIKLTYFNLRGGGEVIRYLLMYGGIDFEDIRVTSEDWPKIKPSMYICMCVCVYVSAYSMSQPMGH